MHFSVRIHQGTPSTAVFSYSAASILQDGILASLYLLATRTNASGTMTSFSALFGSMYALSSNACGKIVGQQIKMHSEALLRYPGQQKAFHLFEFMEELHSGSLNEFFVQAHTFVHIAGSLKKIQVQ